MSLARAFTKRLQRSESKRPKISAPSLITSTNAASYNAPDVGQICRNGVTAHIVTPRSSSEKSDPPTEEPTLTDGSSIESSPIQSPILEQNHLSCYFPGPTKSTINSQPPETAPLVPHRAPSHSKREHERLSRVRSVRSSTGPLSTPSTTDQPSVSSRNSEEYSNLRPMKSVSSLKGAHPFSKELDKLNEVAEELEKGTRAVERDIDESVMERMGLAKFCAEDYIIEIEPLACQRFDDDARFGTNQWDSWI